MSTQAAIQDDLRVEFHDGTEWCDYGPAYQLVAARRQRRFAAATAIKARRWRIVARRPGAVGGTLALDGLAVWREGVAQSRPRQIPFAFSSSQAYSIWLSDRTADIYAGGVFLSSVAIPHRSDELAGVTFAQALDTLILYHPAHAPWRLFRQGAHTEWRSDALPLENVPLFDYDGRATGGVDAVQAVRFRDYVIGDSFRLTLGGETTSTISYSTAAAAAIVAALGRLKDVDADGVSAVQNGDVVTVTFSGKNGSREWPEMFGETVYSSKGGIVVTTQTFGKAGGEPVFSDVRGWPAAGEFFQQRQWLGGYASQPSTVGASVLGDYFNLNAELRSEDAGLDYTIDGTELVEVQHIVGGRNLMVFSAGGEYYIEAGSISRDTTVIRQASSVGSRPGIRPIVVDGPVLFLERRSGAVRAFTFSDAEGSYIPQNVSLHASHLLPDPIGMVRRPARTAKEADLILMPNSGTAPMAVMSLLRSQDVLAFSRFTTPRGQFLDAGVEDGRTVEVAVAREGRVMLEFFRDDLLLDAAQIFTDVSEQSRFDVADLPDGPVAVIVNGRYHCRANALAGRVDLDAPVSGSQIEIGLEFEVAFRTLPVRKQSDQGGFFKDRIRIVRADFNFEICGAYELSVNGGKRYFYEPQTGRVPLGQPLPYFHGPHERKGFLGSSYRPDLFFRQTVPAPFHLRSLDLETTR